MEVEGEQALDSSGMMVPLEILPEHCHLEEGEERWMITPESRDDPKVREWGRWASIESTESLVRLRILSDLDED